MAAYGGLRGLVVVWVFISLWIKFCSLWRLADLSKIACFGGEEKDEVFALSASTFS